MGICEQWTDRTEIWIDERGNWKRRKPAPHYTWSGYTPTKSELYSLFITALATEGFYRDSNRSLMASIEEIREAPGDLGIAQWDALDRAERKLMGEDAPVMPPLPVPALSVNSTTMTTTAKREAPATVVEWAVPINEIRQAVCLQAAEYRKGGLGKSAAMREAWRDVKAGGMSRYVVMPADDDSQLRLAI